MIFVKIFYRIKKYCNPRLKTPQLHHKEIKKHYETLGI